MSRGSTDATRPSHCSGLCQRALQVFRRLNQGRPFLLMCHCSGRSSKSIIRGNFKISLLTSLLSCRLFNSHLRKRSTTCLCDDSSECLMEGSPGRAVISTEVKVHFISVLSLKMSDTTKILESNDPVITVAMKQTSCYEFICTKSVANWTDTDAKSANSAHATGHNEAVKSHEKGSQWRSTEDSAATDTR